MKPTAVRAWHNVRANETTRLPRRYIFIDTEARMRRVKVGNEQTWRLGVACYVVAEKGEKPRERWADYTDPEQLWRDVTEHCRKDSRTILWAHNLGYDVRIASTFNHLPAMGWRLVAHNITSKGTWLEWRREGCTLIMVDSSTVFATKIAKLGEYFRLGKRHVELASDDDAEWLARCRQDVAILKTAMMSYLQWIESADLGNWQMTGSGQSWAAFRHRFLTHKMTIHDDEEALAAERRAMWAGRCEAYWHGELKGQTVCEYDFTQSYVTIARDHPVPVKLIGPMPRGYDWRRIMDSGTSALLAEIEVETDAPVLPASKDGRILWPIGRFRTVVWDVEIAEAIAAGAKVTVIRGWLYRLQPALRAWAEWTISQLDSPDATVPAWQKSILKHWSRALIGRLAMTYNSWSEFGTVPHQQVSRSRLVDIDTGEEYDIMQVGNDVWADAGRVESPNSMPMITGYIQAIARVRLWRVMRELPPHTLLYVDTDSLLVTQKHRSAVESVVSSGIGNGLRLKRSWDGFAIFGPRQIVTGRQVRVSGVPSNAQQLERGKYLGVVWDTLPGALNRGHTGKVIIRDREWTVLGTDHRRRGIGIGWTQPIEIGGE